MYVCVHKQQRTDVTRKKTIRTKNKNSFMLSAYIYINKVNKLILSR
jgi:hypothetical protein